MNKRIQPWVLVILLGSIACTAHAEEGIPYTIQPLIQTTTDFNKISSLKFDPTTFELAYRSFIFTGNVNDAYALCLVATRENKDSILWLSRLAQTALWTSRANVALNTYFQLITDFNQASYLDSTIQLAEKLYRYDMLIRLYKYALSRHPGDPQLMIKLASAYNGAGQPETGVRLLRIEYKKRQNIDYLKAMALIQSQDGHVNAMHETLNEYTKLAPATIETSLLQEQYYISKANLKSAYISLAQQQHLATAQDVNYWDDLAKLAWLTEHYDVSKEAYQEQYRLKTIDEEGLRRLLLLQGGVISPESLMIAATAWNRFHSSFAFFNIQANAPLLQAWPLLASLYQTPLTQEQRFALEQEPIYWTGLAKLLAVNQENDIGIRLLLSETLKRKGDTEFEFATFNFLQDQLSLSQPRNNANYLKNAIVYFKPLLQTSTEWLLSYANAFTLLNDPMQALILVTQSEFSQPASLDVLLQKSSLLGTLHFNRASYVLATEAWRRINQRSPEIITNDTTLLSQFADLAMLSSPITLAYPIDVYLANTFRLTIPLLNQALSMNNIELADRIANVSQPLPVWADLKLAMVHENREKMNTLVTTVPEVLPLKDRITAAMEAGDIPLAQTLAYDSLAKAPEAETLSLFETVMLKTAPKITINPEFEQFGNLQGSRIILTGDWFHAGWKWTPLISVWDPQTNNRGNLNTHSYLEEIAGITATRERERTTLTLNANYHKAFFKSNNAFIDLDYRLDTLTTVGGRLAYNQRSTLGTPMLIAGSEDDAILRYTKQLNARDRLITQVEYDRYYLQDRTSLGSARIVTGGLDHQLYFDYPDIGVSWLTNINRYTRYNAYLGTRVAAIFPPNAPPTVSSFVPDDFWQSSLSLNIGNSALQPIQHAWKPYLDSGLVYDSTAGYGSQFSLGGQGSVFGHDQLKIYYTRSSVNSGQSQTNFIVGLSYDYYLG